MSSALEPFLIAKSTHELGLRPKLANRHGLIAGATGTGKTVTLQRMAEAQTARARRAKPGDGPGTERDARAWQPAGA